MRSLILALGLAALAASPALAASMRGNENLKKYCTGDALTFCGGIDADSPDMDACFKKNRSQMSENCKRAITAYEAEGGK